jgi:hypothetical protein
MILQSFTEPYTEKNCLNSISVVCKQMMVTLEVNIAAMQRINLLNVNASVQTGSKTIFINININCSNLYRE